MTSFTLKIPIVIEVKVGLTKKTYSPEEIKDMIMSDSSVIGNILCRVKLSSILNAIEDQISEKNFTVSEPIDIIEIEIE